MSIDLRGIVNERFSPECPKMASSRLLYPSALQFDAVTHLVIIPTHGGSFPLTVANLVQFDAV